MERRVFLKTVGGVAGAVSLGVPKMFAAAEVTGNAGELEKKEIRVICVISGHHLCVCRINTRADRQSTLAPQPASAFIIHPSSFPPRCLASGKPVVRQW